MKVLRNPSVDEALEQALVDLWVRVTNAGGAVGFLAPVTAEDVAPTAREELAEVMAGRADLVVAVADGHPVGFGFVMPRHVAVARHLGTVKRLQRDPVTGGPGVGREVLRELELAAWDRGLTRLALTARAGTGVEGFYLKCGWELDGRLPGRLVDAGGAEIDELHLSRRRRVASAEGSASSVLPLQRLAPDLPLPGYAHEGDAGLDLYAASDVELAPGARATVPTGVAVAVPPGHVGLVHPRSGLAARHGVGLVNAPGTIDSGYRGEIKVVLVNHDPSTPVQLDRGDRIAQLVVQPVVSPEVVEVAELPTQTTRAGRGARGFGSSGR